MPGDTYGKPDVFVRNRVLRTTARVSVADGGAQADGPSALPAISGSGRYVAFTSQAPALVGTGSERANHVYVRDRRKARTIRVRAGLRGWATLPTIAGSRVAFHLAPTDRIHDLDGPWGDVYVRDLGQPAPRRVTSDGRSGFPALAADGRHLAFASTSALVAGDTNGVADLYVRRP